MYFQHRGYKVLEQCDSSAIMNICWDTLWCFVWRRWFHSALSGFRELIKWKSMKVRIAISQIRTRWSELVWPRLVADKLMITGLGQIDTFIPLDWFPEARDPPLSIRQLTPINFGSHLINVLDVNSSITVYSSLLCVKLQS